MDAVVDFVRSFIQKEHEAHVAMYTERDEAAYQAKIAAANEFLDLEEPVELGLYREENPPEHYFRAASIREMLEHTVARTLFLVQRHKGDIYRCTVSSDYAFPLLSYSMEWFVGLRDDGALKILAKHSVSRNRRVALGGRSVKSLGKALEVRKLTPPTDPDDLAKYSAS